MTTIETRVRVGMDGKVTIPVGLEEAGAEVIVTVTSVPKLTQQEWEEMISRTQGSIDDPTFVRPDQGNYEARDALA